MCDQLLDALLSLPHARVSVFLLYVCYVSHQEQAHEDTFHVKSFISLDLVCYVLFFVNAASLVRRIYIRPGMGVGLFRTVYGGRVRRGAAPEHFTKASGIWISIEYYVLGRFERSMKRWL